LAEKRPHCKDCESTTRKLTPPGPRCATCHRLEKQARRARQHARMALKVYSLPPGTYDTLKAAQNGTCALCQRARGVKRNLAIDHDHSCCPGKTSCGACVRGLLCGPCNDVLATARDDPQYFARAIMYLNSPPARRVLDADMSSLPSGQESYERGPVVEAQPQGDEVRRERNHGSAHESAGWIPGAGEYAEQLAREVSDTKWPFSDDWPFDDA
jgi:hypothetical protein